MKRNNAIILLVIVNCVVSLFTFAQNPIYGNEKEVTINGLTFDAMEPHLSTDGNALFFNSLNNATNTALFYAARVNDTTFNYVGIVPVVNQTVTPYLNAVASLDTADNFYWVSLRDWPTPIENLHRIRFLQSGYTNFGRVYGDFYIPSPGWLIMDAGISYYGEQLIYCNAYFNNCTGVPCKASMGIAQKMNDSTFNKLANTSALFANINDTSNYIVYAPNLSEDGLEFFYTRLLHNGTQTEIMVATRSNTNSAFGMPTLLVGAPSFLPEAPTITTDKSKMYYHKKVGPLFKIFVQYRQSSTSIINNILDISTAVYPNPCNAIIHFNVGNSIEIYNSSGKLKFSGITKEINVSEWPEGIYFTRSGNYSFKFIVSH